MNNRYIKNTLILSFALVISKSIGAVYKIVLTNLIGLDGIGLFQMVFPVFSLFLVLITSGLPVFVARQVSFLRAGGEFEKLKSFFAKCLSLAAVLGIVFSLILFLFSNIFATLQGNSGAVYGYVCVSFAVFFCSLSCVYKGFTQGYENMIPTAFGGVIEQVFKFIFALVFCLYLSKISAEFAVAGAFIAIVLAEIVCFVFNAVYFALKKKTFLPAVKDEKYLTKYEILKGFLPISLSGIVVPLMTCIDSFLVVNLLQKVGFSINVATSLFGVATGIAMPIINFPILFCGTITISLLPNLSFMIAQKKQIEKTISSTLKFVFAFAIPCFFGVFCLSTYIVPALFKCVDSSYFAVASLFLKVVSINIVFMAISQICVCVLNSFGQFKKPLYSQLVGLCIRVVTFVVLVLFFDLSIISLAYAIIFSQAVVCVMNIFFCKQYCNFCLNNKIIFLIILCGIVMYFAILWFNKFIQMSVLFNLVFSIFIGFLVYFILIFVLKIFRLKDILMLFKKDR